MNGSRQSSLLCLGTEFPADSSTQSHYIEISHFAVHVAADRLQKRTDNGVNNIHPSNREAEAEEGIRGRGELPVNDAHV